MKVSIDEDKCIGCGTCSAMAGDFFKLENGKAKVIRQPTNAQEEEMIKNAVNFCPTGAIIISKEG